MDSQSKTRSFTCLAALAPIRRERPQSQAWQVRGNLHDGVVVELPPSAFPTSATVTLLLPRSLPQRGPVNSTFHLRACNCPDDDHPSAVLLAPDRLDSPPLVGEGLDMPTPGRTQPTTLATSRAHRVATYPDSARPWPPNGFPESRVKHQSITQTRRQDPTLRVDSSYHTSHRRPSERLCRSSIPFLRTLNGPVSHSGQRRLRRGFRHSPAFG